MGIMMMRRWSRKKDCFDGDGDNFGAKNGNAETHALDETAMMPEISGYIAISQETPKQPPEPYSPHDNNPSYEPTLYDL